MFTTNAARENVLILLHPRYSSPVQKGLETALIDDNPASLTNTTGRESLMMKEKNASPLEIHLFILKSYLYNWRLYLKSNEEPLIDTVCNLLIKTTRKKREKELQDH